MEKQKCTRCKVLLPVEHFKIKRGGDRTKSCKLCLDREATYRDSHKCTHGRQKCICQKCNGSCICEHNRIKSVCKSCKGGSICEHDRIRSMCIKCKGGHICEHNKIRSRCIQCKGGQICEHNKRRRNCKSCKGSNICEHNKLKSNCRYCKGSNICEHDKLKSHCIKCKGSNICEHDKQRQICKECNFEGYLASKVRNSVYKALKADKTKKSIDYLGCDIETFKKHIEDAFEEGMSWENYGKSSPRTRRWEIDHIIPIKYEKPTLEETVKRLYYTNTMPLWHDENLAKGNRYIGKPTDR